MLPGRRMTSVASWLIWVRYRPSGGCLDYWLFWRGTIHEKLITASEDDSGGGANADVRPISALVTLVRASAQASAGQPTMTHRKLAGQFVWPTVTS